MDIGILGDLVNIIWHYISIWNGSVSESFSLSRAIHQRDPLSPSLFVLCIEKLSQLISIAINNNLLEPIQLSRSGRVLSHLCFADDLLLFAKAFMDKVQVIKGILDLFCKSSGQKENVAKSCVYFSMNVHHSKRRELSQSIFNSLLISEDTSGFPFFMTSARKRTSSLFLLGCKTNQMAGSPGLCHWQDELLLPSRLWHRV